MGATLEHGGFGLNDVADFLPQRFEGKNFVPFFL
jgi:hypothetical protein